MPGYNKFSYLFRDTSFIESELKLPIYYNKNIVMQQEVIIVDETNQETGSFKVRGALYAVNEVRVANRTNNIHINVASSGNFGIGVAFACKKFNIPCTIYLPSYTPTSKLDALTELGANIRNQFKSYETAKYAAIFETNKASEKFKFIDGASNDTFTGNMSLIRQIDRKFNLSNSDSVIVPFGIGSLYIPVLIYSKSLQKNFNVLAIEPKLANKYQRSKKTIKMPKIFHRRTIASGADVSKLPEITTDILNQFEPKVFSVSDKQTRKAMAILETDYGVLSEAAGSLAFAFSLNKNTILNSKRIFYIVTGGNR
jgi:threonine dehydratase